MHCFFQFLLAGRLTNCSIRLILMVRWLVGWLVGWLITFLKFLILKMKKQYRKMKK